MIASSLTRQDCSMGVTARFAVSRCCTPDSIRTCRPSACLSRSSMSVATISITPMARASRAERLTDSRTAWTAHSALRPCRSASALMKAAASLMILRSMVSAGTFSFSSCSFLSLSCLPGSPGMPPIRTGVAAPRLVAGAMAATWLA